MARSAPGGFLTLLYKVGSWDTDGMWTCIALLLLSPDLIQQTRELERAIREGNSARAAEIATELNRGVQGRQRAARRAQAGPTVDKILAMLPAETESFFVLQEPTELSASDSEESFHGRPAMRYVFDRLFAIDNRQWYQRLVGQRILVAATSAANMRNHGQGGIPSDLPDGDLANFYVTEAPLLSDTWPAPVDGIGNIPIWLASSARNDETWIALAKSNLLVMTSNRALLTKLLRGPGVRRAFPAELAEWAHVNRKAHAWGLRHFSTPGERRDRTNPRGRNDDERIVDPDAVGATVQADTESGDMEVRFLSPSRRYLQWMSESVIEMAPGVWRIQSSLRKQGDYPFSLAITILGFGGYL